jgi:hypothetical protein
MRIENRLLLLLAVVAGSAAIASNWRRRIHRTVRDRDYRTELKSWENEGGNLAPVAPPSVPL